MKLLKTLLLLPVLVVGIAAPAMAQTNIAVLNEERVLRESAAGQHIAARMQEIAQEIDSELQAMSQPIQQETERLNADTASMTQAAIQERPDLMSRITTLNQQAQQFEVTRRARQQEIVQTERQAMRPVYEALGPILEEVVAAQGIDILVDRSNLVFASPDIDISASVITLLNERLPTVPVTRVRLPQDGAGQQRPQ
ncbi:outer membrane chaperone Skp [Maricaulis sp. W15]|uniref:Periplasmic chaperone for outer membrane proteins Skp n=1 Tax=Maricaulis maris TaxID=74318 RepID=A0A495DKD2_9PROT|nr:MULTISPECIES: OmpH family outer membrane protein [Maricaulis]OLF77916.1 outer membrane chaperone Skp [Maricaulis sp. W15]RKR02747.1 periplasmic chaperone for outer membrane proteins Skp [Maricaulis maris]